MTNPELPPKEGVKPTCAPDEIQIIDPLKFRGGYKGSHSVSIVMGGLRHSILGSIIDLGLTFNTDPGHRRLNHDCTVFALAHSSPQDHRSKPFHFPKAAGVSGIAISGFKLSPRPLEQFEPHATKPGDIIMTSQGTPKEMEQGIVYGHYAMIHASREHDDTSRPVVYGSKFGTDGPAILHTMPAILHSLPETCTIGVVSSLVEVRYR